MFSLKPCQNLQQQSVQFILACYDSYTSGTENRRKLGHFDT